MPTYCQLIWTPASAHARFPQFSVYGQRLARAAELAAAARIDGLLITPGLDLRYLLGSRAESFERLTCLVIPADGTGACRSSCRRWNWRPLRSSSVDDLGLDVLEWVDGDDPYRLAASVLPQSAHTAVTDAMPALHLLPLAATFGTLPVLATPVLREMRMIKDASEIQALVEAGKAIDRVHARMGEWLVAGRTEAEVAADIGAAIVVKATPRRRSSSSGPAATEPIRITRCPTGASRQATSSSSISAGPSNLATTPTPPAPTREPAARSSNDCDFNARRLPASPRFGRVSPQSPSMLLPARSWPRPGSPRSSCTEPDMASDCRSTKSPTSWRAM